MPSLKDRAAAAEVRVNTAEAWADEMSDKVFKFWTLFKGPNRTVGSKRVCVVGLIDAKLERVWLVITAVLSEKEGTVSEAICNVRNSFSVKASYDVKGQSAGGSSDQA